MNKIIFHSNQLGIRGTEVALYDYAKYNEELLGNKSYIVSDKNGDLTTLKKFKDRFDIFLYDDFSEVEKYACDNSITHAYFIKQGDDDGKVIKGVKNLIHTVFQFREPHGDVYTYISQWLAESVGDGSNNFIPHIVTLPTPTQSIRDALNIPASATVLGRHGGMYEFDIPYVVKAIEDALKSRDDLYFIFMNTCPFIKHERVVFIEGTYNLQNKSNFINSCDGMIHARTRGETFGLAICEYLYHNKPVIAYNGGHDLNHLCILQNMGILYDDYETCLKHLVNFDKTLQDRFDYRQLVQPFSPENVMAKFCKIFL